MAVVFIAKFAQSGQIILAERFASPTRHVRVARIARIANVARVT